MRHLLVPMLAAWLCLAPSCGKAQDGGKKAQGAAIAVIDFGYIDSSGEERDQRKEHEARLDSFMRALKGDLAKGSFQLITPACVPSPCSLAGLSVANLLAAAREAGADILLIGGIHKMSTLVQWAKVDLVDVKTRNVVFNRLVTFRGDNDKAWRHAESFIVRQILDHEDQ